MSLHAGHLDAITGLCLTGLKDVSDFLARTYILKIEGVANDAKKLIVPRIGSDGMLTASALESRGMSKLLPED